MKKEEKVGKGIKFKTNTPELNLFLSQVIWKVFFPFKKVLLFFSYLIQFS